MEKQPHHRVIRSYVLREGRLTGGQSRALEQHWPRFGIDFSKQLLDLDARFGRRAAKILDIGSGNGDSVLALARRFPENDYLAVEVHRPGVGNLLRRIAEEHYDNILVIRHDAVEVLRFQIPDNSLDAVHILFPDPWPKKKHHKRRLVSERFLRQLYPKLKNHARLYLATDWRDLAEHMLEVCDAFPGLINLAGTGHFSPRPLWRHRTKFEQRGKKLEHEVYDLIYCPE
ncbi:MAG: tRNA (guanosine(46)-N7)-methyltransferase TrmB [Gammaproteobacteria bacterium]